MPVFPPFDYVVPNEDQNEGQHEAQVGSRWTRLSKKQGGANDAGTYGGLYTLASEQEGEKPSKFYVKQDPEEDKNICEVFASQFMRFIAEEIGESPDLIADVNYIQTPDDGVYIASYVFEGYRDLFKDAYLAYQIPPYDKSRVGEDWKSIPSSRPKYLSADSNIDKIVQLGRYDGLIPGLALRAIVDDPDVHYENIGAVAVNPSGLDDRIPIYENDKFSGKCYKKVAEPTQDSEEINGEHYVIEEMAQEWVDEHPELIKEFYIKKDDKSYFIPNSKNTRAVNIDFGGALGDFRPRTLDGKIHYADGILTLMRYRPSTEGPPAYHTEIPKGIRDGDEFFKTLARYSMVDKHKIKRKIDEQVDVAIGHYRNKPEVLLRFAQRVGAKIPSGANAKPDHIADYLKSHLLECFIARQKHAKKLFLNYMCNMDNASRNNLFRSYEEDGLIPKEITIKNLITQLKAENTDLFAMLEGIEALGSEIKEVDDKKTFNALKNILYERILDAQANDRIKKETLEIRNILLNTRDLIKAHQVAMGEVKNPDSEDDTKLRAVETFIEAAKEYEQACITLSGRQKFAIAACCVVGTLIGICLGALTGLAIGAVAGGAAGSVAPAVGNIIGAIGAGSVGGVIGAIKGAGLGAMIGTAVGAFLFGSSFAYGAGKITRFGMFSTTDKEVSHLTKSLIDQLEEAQKVQEVHEAQENGLQDSIEKQVITI
ncbi:Uncharacterised protein [Legionella beliardensis]|uniref:Dot/Icm T4SS effector n=1 Tax=Legionella beliardensis TaxID=91822 RepID=A0A378I4U4_9GAMM|nr:hypothetical protein [Legionella beliardensis]STX29770.1 Uncharacterised protein [Legionella beliardensis]